MPHIFRKHPRHPLCPDSSILLAPLCLLTVLMVLSCFTGLWPWSPNVYNSYVLQADAWLHGHLDLGQDYPWLELAIYDGQYFVSFPPFPSYLLLPFVAVFGPSFPDGILSIFVSLLGISVAARICVFTTGKGPQTLFYPLFLYLGTGFLFLAHTPWTWFLAQSLCFTLSLCAIDCALHNRGGWSLTLWACSVGCRPFSLLFLPVLIVILYRNRHPRHPVRWVMQHLSWAIGPLLIASSYMALNYLRFGNVLEFGHNYLPEFVRAEYGQFSLRYLPDHLRMLLRLPSYDTSSGRLVIDHVETTLLPMENPMLVTFVLALILFHRSPCTQKPSMRCLLPVLCLIHMLLTCMHRTLGAFQYGNRYFLDSMPYMFLGIIEWKGEDPRFTRMQWPLFALGFSLSLLGTVTAYNGW